MAKETKRKGTTGDTNTIILTTVEALLIWRRRNKLNQTQAAKIHKVSLFQYKLMEYGKLESKKPIKSVLLLDNEKCFIYRKRSGKKQSEIAKIYGCGRYWLRQQELGKIPCDRLLAWWENR